MNHRQESLVDTPAGFFLGGATWRRDPIQGRYPKTENHLDLGHYFFLEEPKFTYEKNIDLSPTGPGSPTHKNMTEVDIFMYQKNVRFLMYESWC